jgi:DNA-binding GntR family transcriptional regulator
MKPSQREIAYRHIRRRLIEGTLTTGARLSPVALAGEIGISHTPVREAISQLQSEGLVVHSSHRGAFVKALTRHELVEVIDLRTTLECHAAAEAARRIDPDQLRELDERWQDFCRANEACDLATDVELEELGPKFHLADLCFHMVLLRAAGNRLAMRVIEDNRIMTMMFGHRTDSPKSWADRGVWRDANLQVHKDIFEAVRRHDPKAARRAMAIHMHRAGKTMLARFDWLQQPPDSNSSLLRDFPDSLREAIRSIERRKPAEE